MDREGFAEFLRIRREGLQPADVGLHPGRRRRTPGLRREEVADLAAMSTDFYARLEQARGSRPSEQTVAAIARALRLTPGERDHAYRLAGYTPPVNLTRTSEPTPSMLRILEQLSTPAMLVSDLGVMLRQNALSIALQGDLSGDGTLETNTIYRWFMDPHGRRGIPQDDHVFHSRNHVSQLRAAHGRDPESPDANELIGALQAGSREFADLWASHEVGYRFHSRKRFEHQSIGMLHLDCEVLTAEHLTERLVVFTARPGTEDADKLRLLSVVGNQEFPLAAP